MSQAKGISPGRGLLRGQPTGSAAPLVWAHAEYLKLWRSLRDRQVFDTLPLVARRFAGKATVAAYVSWRFNSKLRTMPPGRNLRVGVLAPGHWCTGALTTGKRFKIPQPGTRALGSLWPTCLRPGCRPGRPCASPFSGRVPGAGMGRTLRWKSADRMGPAGI